MSLFKKQKTDMPRRRSDNRDAPGSVSSNVFKRNRTLTGTTSTNIDGIRADSDLTSPRKHTHKLTILRRKISGVLLVIVIASAALWFLVSHLTAFAVINATDSRLSKPLDKQIYEGVIQDYLDANPMSRFSFLLSEKDLTEYVAAQLPEVSAVTQQGMAGIGGTGFDIRMRTPIAGWHINGKQFYVDSNGIPFERNYYSAPVVQIVDNSGVTVKNSSTAIASKRFLAFVGRVVHLTKNSGYTVTEALLPINTTRELEVHLSEVGYYVKLSIDRPAGEQVEDMVNAIHYFANNASPSKYIDVRVSGKAFYR